jgi:lysyl-tRNA synthetase class 2
VNLPTFNEILGQNEQTRVRELKLAEIARLVGNPYPNKFERSRVSGAEDSISNLKNFAEQITRKYFAALPEDEKPFDSAREAANEELKSLGTVRTSGRLAVPPRVMGKAAFVHLSDGVERLQIYVRRDDAQAVYNGEIYSKENPKSVNGWELFNLLDHGDFIGVSGFLFVTKTGELSIHVETLQFLAKALLPMPDKMHGIADPEIRQRQRYADLIASSLKVERDSGELTTRQVFERRARLISELRRFLDDAGYTEVETPMLTPKATGAAARAFETHHNALDITLYARIAPELYLKRLIVGGFEKVYELNRNFRNEGISTRHNPEFTMLEFYAAYMDSSAMMDFAERMLRAVIEKVHGGLQVRYGETEIDFSRFERLTMRQAVERYAPPDVLRVGEIADENLALWFEEYAEEKLIQPTFITDFPKKISPLSKTSPQNPQIAERFELFINKMECANGFSELNAPKEQYERFVEQMRERESGDEEAMVLDEDYVRALAYAMPPAAGIGIGIDRLTMILTNRHSIREVILFPHLRPEKPESEE